LSRTTAIRFPAGAALALFLATSLGGCLRSGTPMGVALRSPTQFDFELKRYREMASRKAMAVAGDVGGRYVIGYSHAYPTTDMAIESALEFCEQRRVERRIEAECRIYAVDDEVVSEDASGD
jgi:hypothetical protein